MKRRHLAPLVAVLAACSSGTQQPAAAPAPAGPLPQPVAAPAIFGLLGDRERLGLSSDQIGRLEAVAVELRERNDSLETAIREEQRQRRGRRSAREQQRVLREALPTLGQIWSNNRRAMQQVHDVLTPQQRDRVCEVERERLPERELEARRREEEARRAGNRPMPRMRGIRPMRPDSVLASAVRGWAWCAPGATARPAAPAPAPTPRTP